MIKRLTQNIPAALLILIVFLAAPLTLICNRHSAGNLPALLGAQVRHPGSYSILIDTDANRLYLMENGRVFKKYKCAVGKSSTPSPIGSFQIVRKSLWGEGFGGYYLGLNVPWGDYGIHGTTHPDSVGSDISHGCFRMYNEDIRELYGYVGIGTSVLVVTGNYGAFGGGFRTLSPGMSGQDVYLIQKRLRQLGYFRGFCNGRYDTESFRLAVRKFQKDNGLPVSDSITRDMLAKLGFSVIE